MNYYFFHRKFCNISPDVHHLFSTMHPGVYVSLRYHIFRQSAMHLILEKEQDSLSQETFFQWCKLQFKRLSVMNIAQNEHWLIGGFISPYATRINLLYVVTYSLWLNLSIPPFNSHNDKFWSPFVSSFPFSVYWQLLLNRNCEHPTRHVILEILWPSLLAILRKRW